MKSNTYDKFLGFTAFGESHSPAIGLVIEDVKPGIEFPQKVIQKALDERKPGKGKFLTTRQEADKIEILSGVLNGITTGMPICLVVYNKNAKPEDYEHLKNVFRPGHADYSLFQKFKIYDYRGGGRASGRETISRVAAAGMVNDILKDIQINIYPVQIGKITASKIGKNQNELLWPDSDSFEKLQLYLEEIRKSGNSTGGIVEVKIQNLPSGLGDPVFEKLDANLAKAILSIGGVKGIEFGDGFELAKLTGSEANDQLEESGFLSNHSGGILGGISTGQTLKLRFVVKPTSSINIEQKTITHDGKNTKITVGGRHDVCIIPRLIPVAKAMIKLVLADAISYQKLVKNEKQDLSDYREAIDKIDEDILIAIKRRMEISKLIGKFKKYSQLKIENLQREKELLRSLQEKAGKLGISEDLIESIWKNIIAESKNMQDTIYTVRSDCDTSKKC
ncbi:MAG: chorismate synthase [Candidatus Cloacimonetes bacterium]|nr:chorismate synthase [Candidatus Cloacimonadota bacterium]MCF7813819.1 chorismate synthase [Candidatus Cloacimonadota bacterium]MCF7868498.1 chorismate synthase [Candidatus Cloacimonadota bacterium]